MNYSLLLLYCVKSDKVFNLKLERQIEVIYNHILFCESIL